MLSPISENSHHLHTQTHTYTCGTAVCFRFRHSERLESARPTTTHQQHSSLFALHSDRNATQQCVECVCIKNTRQRTLHPLARVTSHQYSTHRETAHLGSSTRMRRQPQPTVAPLLSVLRVNYFHQNTHTQPFFLFHTFTHCISIPKPINCILSITSSNRYHF